MEERLLMVINRIIKVDKLSLKTNRKEIEKWDSLAHVMIIAEIEDEFNINIPFDDIEKINTINDFLIYLKE